MEEERGGEEDEEGSLSTPPNPSRFVPEGANARVWHSHDYRRHSFSLKLIFTCGASRTSEARGTSAGLVLRLLIGSLTASPLEKSRRARRHSPITPSAASETAA
jgi:hypothetical protein